MRRALLLLSVLVMPATGCGDGGGVIEDPDALPEEPVEIRMG